MFIYANIRKIFLFKKLFEFYLLSIKNKGPLRRLTLEEALHTTTRKN